jgi:hypothetical protein
LLFLEVRMVHSLDRVEEGKLSSGNEKGPEAAPQGLS